MTTQEITTRRRSNPTGRAGDSVQKILEVIENHCFIRILFAGRFWKKVSLVLFHASNVSIRIRGIGPDLPEQVGRP
jgi:hypothetical protein